MKNRMREIRTSGSVRGEEGNLLPYSTFRDARTGRGVGGASPTLQLPVRPEGRACETKPIGGLAIPKAGGLEAATRPHEMLLHTNTCGTVMA